MTPAQGAAKLRLKISALRNEVRKALTKSADRGRQLAIMNSSGPYSELLLAYYGHPYSKRRPNSAFNPSIINVQTGRFRNAWKSTGSQKFAGGYRAMITNNTPYAEELIRVSRFGLNTVRRPVDVLTAQETMPYFLQYVTDAVEKGCSA